MLKNVTNRECIRKMHQKIIEIIRDRNNKLIWKG